MINQKPSTVKNAGSEHPHEELKRLRQDNKLLKEERDILKKAAAYFAKKQSVKYAWMQQQTEFSVQVMRRVLQVSRNNRYEAPLVFEQMNKSA